jgi:uncharacterized protein (DUF302 family)
MMDGMQVAYGMGRTLAVPYEEADRRVREALQQEGFGVLTEIDVRQTLKNKLDVDFPPYVILGACNPPMAHRALTMEPDIGLLLPCNVVVRSIGDDRTLVEALDPVVQLEVSGNPELAPLARQVREMMARVLERLGTD